MSHDASQNESGSGCAPSSCKTCSSSSCSAHTKQGSESDKEFAERQKITARLRGIKHKILVMSGKGGVGKSTVATNLALGLHLSGKKVGLMDVDIHGPSVPTMLGLEGQQITVGPDGDLQPVDLDGLKVISIGFFLNNDDDAVIWRGPVKAGVITQFIRDVAWGELDYLIVDLPPGTGDEPLTVIQTIPAADGAVIVTTPQKVAAVDVRKSISFCRKIELPVIGVVENMSGYVCPCCGEETAVFRSGGGKTMADDMQVPFLGSVPIDPKIAEAGDSGEPFIKRYSESQTATRFKEIIAPILELSPRAS